ncbi:MAG: hypothetical protein LQ345_002051 [Seirophora villosa]|nr:MAG: hypothetical protein LQ345_002051 [Seirophora villosa]
MSPSLPLKPYDKTFFEHYLTQIEQFHAYYLHLSAVPTPCRLCQIALLNVIADDIAKLLTMRPSEDIDQELKDMKRLDSVSRSLLKVDEQGITQKVWVLLSNKIRSLATVPACRFAVDEETYSKKTARMVYVVRDGGDRRDEKAMASVSRSAVVERQPKASVSDSAVVERQPRASASGSAVVERQPRASASRSAVVERQPRASVSDFAVVERQPRPAASRSAVIERQPRTSVSAFNVEERQPTPTVSSTNTTPVPAQSPSSIASFRLDPSIAARMMGSLRGIIAELESGA